MSQSIIIPLDFKLADILQAAIQSTFQDSFQIETKVSAWSVENGPLLLEPYIVCTMLMKHAVSKETCGTMIAGFSQGALTKILEIYGSPTTEPKVIQDAAEELVNMIYGTVKTALSQDGYPLSMAFPSTDLKNIPSANKIGSSEKMIVPFSASGFQCCIVIAKIL